MQIDSTADTQVKKVADTYHFIQCYAIKRRKNNHFNIPRNLTNLFNTEFRYLLLFRRVLCTIKISLSFLLKTAYYKNTSRSEHHA